MAKKVSVGKQRKQKQEFKRLEEKAEILDKIKVVNRMKPSFVKIEKKAKLMKKFRKVLGK